MKTSDNSKAAKLAAFFTILAAAIHCLKKHPYIAYSYLPIRHIVQSSTALAAAGFGVSSLQKAGGAQ
ncbi:MAG: hypothetical protein Q8K21_17270 [Hydrogenophaga sp.]|uniref:hypothetical protein n=1 Tax=Hydrogenophaga sp. TaxID=1904254 RepID=UPI00272F7788|nr:hypothetical protein [Hydrogenophaga sp.]MDP2165932.1 hypothetical protein [Hydrogenophaga sp.]MDP3476175.1 hypothetical protein [Hydrogenophaga sp.]